MSQIDDLIFDISLHHSVALNYKNNATSAASFIIVIMTRVKRVGLIPCNPTHSQSSGINLLSPIQLINKLYLLNNNNYTDSENYTNNKKYTDI